MNISNILILNFVILFIIIVTALILVVKYAKLVLKYNKLYKYMKNHLNIITSARYGNFNNKFENGFDEITKQLDLNINALLESVIDRDKMIQEYIEKEKQSQNIKSDFISCLTHDLKVPIIAQDNTYDLFLNGNFGEITKLQKNVIKNLKNSNIDLKNLVINLLDAQKLDSGQINLNFENVNIVEFIKTIIAQNEAILALKEKEIIFSYNQNDIFLKIDTLALKRVLNNLISNALYYSKNSKQIYIDLFKDDKEVKITVKDKGLGINEQDINNIFKKYYTCSKKYSNISFGLGLYIANKIITAHKAKLEAKNNNDCGASFIITFKM